MNMSIEGNETEESKAKSRETETKATEGNKEKMKGR